MIAAARIPNQEAIALSSAMGWWFLAAALCLVLFFAGHREAWRRWWLQVEDPRSLGLFRLVFGFFVICNVNGMWEYFTYLFTDEGIFPTDVAQQVFASHQFAGYGDGHGGDPTGFFDVAAFLRYLSGPKFSLLFFWDSPTFFWGYIAAFELCALAFMLGLWTRPMGIATWLLMNGLLYRNHLMWEGTELVFRCFLAYLVVSRCGHAYSIDNWRRCRRLRAQGRLSERDGPGGGAGAAPSETHPRGLEAVYRLIPAWPRRLLMLQLATIYLTTGTLKTGGVWLRGDSLYYALNLDHFYRVPPQYMASLFGTNLFRGLTWFVKIGQSAFALVLFGLVVRWAARQRLPARSATDRALSRLGWLGVILCSTGIIYTAWPVHHVPLGMRTPFAGAWAGVLLALWALWAWLGKGVTLTVLGRRVTIDRMFVARWVLGRRVLLVWHLGFHAHIITLMNVGHFQTAMMSATIFFLHGREVAELLCGVGSWLRRRGIRWIPAAVDRGPLPAQAHDLAPRFGAASRLPVGVVIGAGALAVLGVVLRAHEVTGWSAAWWASVGVLALASWRARPDQQLPPAAWAYGKFGRLFIGTLVVWHLGAVASWLLPDKDCLKNFRTPARAVVGPWLRTTTTDQGWGMFAPNPPRHNVFLKVLVTDAEGDVWDLKTDVYAAEQKPMPWIWNTRLRKMNRRIIGGESGPSDWYRKWHARYHCRQWALDHGGETPQQVQLVKVSYRIPTPEQVHAKGYYVPESLLERAGNEVVKYTEKCATSPLGQLPNHIRARHGLPRLPESIPHKPWVKHRKRKWDRAQRRKAKKD